MIDILIKIVVLFVKITLLFIVMLPQLGKKKSADVNNQPRSSQPRLNAGETEITDTRKNVKSVSAKKVRTGGGFMKSNLIQQPQAKNAYAQHIMQGDTHSKIVKIKRNQDLSTEIKMIQRKIKACQRRLEEDRRRQKQMAQQSTKQKDRPQYNFDKVVQRQLELQGYQSPPEENNQNFDYLTNPKLNPNQQQQQPQPIEEKQIIVQAKPYNIEAGIQKLQKFYQNSLKKKFQRREMFPHQACRRKTPKLYITQKTNALNKYGRAQNQAQHLFRVLTKQTTPQQIYPTIPNFAVVKDNLSKNIVAYLGDYKPFLDKTKEGVLSGSLKGTDQQKQQNMDEKEDGATSKIGRPHNGKVKQEFQINIKSKTRQSVAENTPA